MGCFSNKTKLCCEKVVLVIGIIELIFGIAAGVWGFLGSNHGADIDFTGTSFPSPTIAFAIMALIGGLLTVIVGLLALCTAKYKVCCFACPFMVLSLIMCIIMLIVAFMGLLAGSYKKEAKKVICTEKMKNNWKNLEFYNNIIYGELIDKYMCSNYCPCPPAATIGAPMVATYNKAINDRNLKIVVGQGTKRIDPYVEAGPGVTPVNNWAECVASPKMQKLLN